MPLHSWQCEHCGTSRTENIPVADIDKGRHPMSESFACRCGGKMKYEFGAKTHISLKYPFHKMPTRMYDIAKREEKELHQGINFGRQMEKQEKAVGEQRIAREGRKVVIGA